MWSRRVVGGPSAGSSVVARPSDALVRLLLLLALAGVTVGVRSLPAGADVEEEAPTGAVTTACVSGLDGPVLPLSGAVTLAIKEGERLALDYAFGAERGAFTTAIVRYDIELPGADGAGVPDGGYLPIRFGEIRRVNDSQNVPRDAFGAEAQIISGEEVWVRACLDTTGLRAGTYETTLRVIHPAVTHTPMALRLTLRSTATWGIYFTIALSCAVGALMLFLRTADQWRTTVRSRRFLLSVAGGIIAALSVNLIAALNDPDFGVGMSDYLELFVGSLAAFLLGEGVIGAAAGVRAWTLEEGEARGGGETQEPDQANGGGDEPSGPADVGAREAGPGSGSGKATDEAETPTDS